MPKKTVNGGVLAKLGDAGQKAVEAHRGDKTTVRTGNLPAGIKSGTARLNMCKFDTYKSGKFVGQPYFMAMGTVLDPEEHNAQKIKGLMTSLSPIPLCETPDRAPGHQSLDEHIGEVLNEMRKLGVDTKDLGLEDLEATAASLQEAKPYFHFSTSLGKATDDYPATVFENWNGSCSWDEEESSGVDDQTAAEAAAKPTPAKPSPKSAPVKVTPKAEESLDSILTKANNNNSDAQHKLTELATEHGIDAESLGSWSEVKDAIEAAQDGAQAASEIASSGTETANGDKPEPTKGEIWWYKPPRTRSHVECEVTAVDRKAKKVDLKNLSNGEDTPYKAVSWEAIAESEPS
jgi:pyruvate/2-oxoglutarate dehydrogenase complex dihydrolipoamide acyltransferase (E2) component